MHQQTLLGCSNKTKHDLWRRERKRERKKKEKKKEKKKKKKKSGKTGSTFLAISIVDRETLSIKPVFVALSFTPCNGALL